jgi:hypothetical protein
MNKLLKKDYCKKSICKNGGVCYANGEIEYCECVKGLNGNLCELSIKNKNKIYFELQFSLA